VRTSNRRPISVRGADPLQPQQPQEVGNVPFLRHATIFPTREYVNHLDLVADALRGKGRLPLTPPCTPFLPRYCRSDNLAAFNLKKFPGGWVANIAFRNVPPGEPGTIGTKERRPFVTQQEAFLTGAEMLCLLVTESREPPFFLHRDTLICAGYGSSGEAS
jgi:hypothetical protein